jgi:hypothetical protein
MVKKLLGPFFFLFVILFSNIKSDNLCNLKIADNELSSLRGGSDLIYNDGIINDNWDENNHFSLHISSFQNEIDFLYATEVHTGGAPHEKMVKNK